MAVATALAQRRCPPLTSAPVSAVIFDDELTPGQLRNLEKVTAPRCGTGGRCPGRSLTPCSGGAATGALPRG